MTKIFGLDKSAETRRNLHTHTHTHTHTGKSCQVIFSAILILGAIGRVSAEPINTSDTFPLNELMQPDYRYLNSAIYPNTGVYDGDVMVNAMYDWDLFSPTAGQYLPANSTTITQCTSGSFCTGATNIHYDSVDQGITACSTLGDNSYTQSATGSASETDCYRNCSGNVTIEHATTITGNDYYGAGTDTCSATACEGGYHTDNNACGANVLTITWANSDNPNTTCTYGGSITTPATAPTIPGKTFVGWRVQLPYTPIEYVEFCTTCYINTQKQIGSNFEIYGTTMILDGAQIFDYILASDHIYDYSYTEFFVRISKSSPTALLASSISGDQYNGGIDYPGHNIKFTFGISPYWLKYGNGNVRELVRPQTKNEILMIGSSIAGYNTVPMRVYNVQMYNNGLLDLDLIPVKDANGVACMYDRVGKRFYYNSGTGNFIAGPNL